MIGIFKRLLLLSHFEFDDECPIVSLREREREIIIINLDTPTSYTNFFLYIRKQNGLFIYMC